MCTQLVAARAESSYVNTDTYTNQKSVVTCWNRACFEISFFQLLQIHLLTPQELWAVLSSSREAAEKACISVMEWTFLTSLISKTEQFICKQRIHDNAIFHSSHRGQLYFLQSPQHVNTEIYHRIKLPAYQPLVSELSILFWKNLLWSMLLDIFPCSLSFGPCANSHMDLIKQLSHHNCADMGK